MTWPSNDYYVRQRMNDHFAYQNTCRVLQEQRDRIQKLLVKTSSESDSDSDDLTSGSQKYRDSEKYIFSKKFKEAQAKKIAKPNSEGTSLLSNNTKKDSLILRLRHIVFPCCCIQ